MRTKLKTIAEIEDTRDAGIERLLEFCEATVKECIHVGRDAESCRCRFLMDALTDAGRTVDCDRCQGCGCSECFEECGQVIQ